MFKTKNKGSIQHLTIDSTELKVYGEREWKVKKIMVLMKNVNLA
ncbi:Mobile element protein [Candidatus Enterovibrio altilux]|uniref:Mobile element protein n=1 Tax=Candidatus Enterovibrio altilux TaxID=1927128 RepID=A0A291B7V5_9GAMM|nr:Mobile element protein [Candidatus Enterovibrio luxaltus]